MPDLLNNNLLFNISEADWVALFADNADITNKTKPDLISCVLLISGAGVRTSHQRT